MTLDLPRLARQQGRRRNVTLRPIVPTQARSTDLAAIIAPAWRIWAEAIEAILAAYDPAPLTRDEYSEKYSSGTLTIDSPDAAQTVLNTIAAEFLTRLVTEITPALRRWVVRSERWHRSKWIAAVKAGTGVDLATVLLAQPVEETLQSFIARNVALAKNISDQAQSRIADAVFRGYQARTPVREVAKEIREAANLGRKRAIRIAAHQNNALSGALDQERMAEAGISLWKWRHSGKRNPRQEHKARDGRIYRVGSNMRVKPDGTAMASGETIAPGQGPSELPNCGCRRQAYLPIMAEL